MIETSDQQSINRDRYLECIWISFQGSASLHLDVTLPGVCRSEPKHILVNVLRDEFQPPELADDCKSILCQSGGNCDQKPRFQISLKDGETPKLCTFSFDTGEHSILNSLQYILMFYHF